MVIQEFLPNPVGKDADGEYIKLFNDGQAVVNLNGWKIKDAGGKIFKLDGYSLDPQKELVLDYAVTKIFLNNDGETLFLYNSAGSLIDEKGYSGKAEEGVSYGGEIVFSEEFKQEFLENFPEPPAAIYNKVSLTGFLTAMLVTGLALTIIAAVVIKHFKIPESTLTSSKSKYENS